MSSPLDVEGGGKESDRVLPLLLTKATGRDNPVLNGGTVGEEEGEDNDVGVDGSMFEKKDKIMHCRQSPLTLMSQQQQDKHWHTTL